MANKQYDVYGIGAALLDIDFEISEATLTRLNITKGLMTLIDEEREQQLLEDLDGVKHVKACGGSAANSLITLQLLGGQGYFSCKVASDAMGQVYIDDLMRSGLDTNPTARSNVGVTGKCIAMITPDTERTMHTNLGVNEFLSVDDLDLNIVPNCQYIYIEGYLASPPHHRKNAAVKLREAADQHGKKVALSLSDPNIVRQYRKELMDIVGPGVQMFFCNEKEALLFSQASDIKSAGQVLQKYAKQWAITCGARGMVGFDGKQWFELPSYPADPVDGIGAGDVFAGGFLYALTHGFNFATAADIGCFAASRVVTKFGPRLDPSHLLEVKQHMQRQRILQQTLTRVDAIEV